VTAGGRRDRLTNIIPENLAQLDRGEVGIGGSGECEELMI
jgi:hypothetical protein